MAISNAKLIFERAKRLAGNNTKCFHIIMKLFENDRDDIYQAISDLQHQDANAVDADKIVKVYVEQCHESIDEFIALFDKQMKSAARIRKNYYNEYEKDVEKLNKEMITGKKEPEKREFYTSKYHKYMG